MPPAATAAAGVLLPPNAAAPVPPPIALAPLTSSSSATPLAHHRSLSSPRNSLSGLSSSTDQPRSPADPQTLSLEDFFTSWLSNSSSLSRRRRPPLPRPFRRLLALFARLAAVIPVPPTSSASLQSDPTMTPAIDLSPATWSRAQVAVLGQQTLFVGTGLVSTLGAQWLFYRGAADAQSMLTILATYLGMAAILLVPTPRKSKSAYVPVSTADPDFDDDDPPEERSLFAPNLPHARMMCVAALDVFGTIVLTVGLFFVGSGLYQVIYSSVIVFTALMSRVFLSRNLTRGQWAAVFTITLGLSLTAFGGSSGGDVHGDFGSEKSDDSGVIAGFLITLTGTCIYAGVYTLNDHTLTTTTAHPPPSPRQQCFWVGTYCTLLTLFLQLLYSLPHLAHMPLTQTPVIFMYLLLILSSLGHNMAYFALLEKTGAVATGIMQALRAVLVFGLSHVLFCGVDGGQCYSVVKGVATVVVVVGVVAFAVAKGKKRGGRVVEMVEVEGGKGGE